MILESYDDVGVLYAPVAASTSFSRGDLIYWDASARVAKKASQQSDAGSEAANQLAFANNFLGICLANRLNTEPAGTIPVATMFKCKYTCTSADQKIGTLFGADEAASGTALEDQSIKVVTDKETAIAVSVVDTGGASTSASVIFQSRVATTLAFLEYPA